MHQYLQELRLTAMRTKPSIPKILRATRMLSDSTVSWGLLWHRCFSCCKNKKQKTKTKKLEKSPLLPMRGTKQTSLRETQLQHNKKVSQSVSLSSFLKYHLFKSVFQEVSQSFYPSTKNMEHLSCWKGMRTVIKTKLKL